MKRHFKPLVVGVALIAALLLTITRQGPNGALGVSAPMTSGAAPQRGSKPYDLAALNVFRVVLGRITTAYVEPKRIKPKRMLIKALDAIEKNVAEVLVEENKKKKTVTVHVQDVSRTFNIKRVDAPWALISVVKDVLSFIQPHLHPSTEIRDVEYAAINGMLDTLDPHSTLLPPDLYKEMKLSTRGQFGGLGIVISMIKGVLTVMKPIKGTPASDAGIRACDQILKIGPLSTVNMTLNQAVKRLRGDPGSKVTITLMRKGWSRPVRKTLTRDIVKVDSVSSRLLAQKIGYVRLSSFQGNSYADIRQALRKLKRKGMRGLVLDLRGNPGGLLDQAIRISDLFIDSGTLLTTVSHAGKQREEKRAHRKDTEPRYPIAVLVNSGSASASEIVSGALKHLDRGVIIGTRTFGKGSVQVLYDNEDDSALKLTIAQYLTPGDISIQSTGITPDIVTAPVVIRPEYIRLRHKDDAPREKSLPQHLTHRNVKRNTKPTRQMRYLATKPKRDKRHKRRESASDNLCLYPDRRCEPPEDDEFVEDFQIRMARQLLAQTTHWRRSQVLATSSALLGRLQAEQDRRVIDALRKVGVDWSAPSSSNSKAKKPQLALSVETDPSGGTARACEKMKIKVTVRNLGHTAVSQLRGVTESTNRLFANRELVFGRIEPGKSRSWTVPVKVRDAPTRVDDVTLKLFDGRNREYPEHHVQLGVKGVARPVFAYSYQLLDDLGGNLDGRPQRGEKLRLFMKVRNTGKGASFRTVTRLKNLSGEGVFIHKGRFVLGRMKPGDVRTASFTLELQPSYKRDAFKVQLTVMDEGLREHVTEKLRFDVVPQGKPVLTARGYVKASQKARFRAWPDAKAPVVGYGKRGATFRVLGRTNDGWYRVKASAKRPAFVYKSDVRPSTSRGRSRFIARWQVTPPKLTLRIPAHVTTKDHITIGGVATDETRVSDLYIFVRNPDAKIPTRKIFYRSNRKSKTPRKLSFSAKVPLWTGANYVTVYSRENHEVQSSDMVVIFRRKPNAMAHRVKAAAR